MMSQGGICGFEHDDGAYILGALSPEDRAAFERHLPDCDACTRSVRELAGLPGLLARVPVEVLEGDHQTPTVPPTLLPALLSRVQRARRRRVWATAGMAAAAAAVVGVVVGVSVDHNSSTPTAPVAAARAFAPVGAEPISGWVSLTKVGWGTRLDLTCSYAGENAYGGGGAVTYTMVVTRTDGTTEQVASWKALPGVTMKLAAATAAAPSDIASVVVRDQSGKDVLRLAND